MDLQTPRDIMREKGISPSVTRTKIYTYLDAECHHPTVDEIYHALIDELPTLSKTTVYNTLKLFVEHELVKAVATGTTESRYELYHEPHSHFQCVSCGKLYDIPRIKPSYRTIDLTGFDVLEEDVTLKGYCPNCQAVQHQ